MKIHQLFLVFFLVIISYACVKTDKYIPKPYTCECGRITWNGVEHQVTGVGGAYLSFDSLGFSDTNTRKFDLTTSIKDETDENDLQAHHINTAFEFEDISNIFYYIVNDTTAIDTTIIDPSITQPTIIITELNQNNGESPNTHYQAIDGTIQINVTDDGLQDEVKFNLTIKETNGSSTFGNPIPYSGTFTFDRK